MPSHVREETPEERALIERWALAGGVSIRINQPAVMRAGKPVAVDAAIMRKDH